MKIFTADQIYKADEFTIKNQNLGNHELMERAGIQAFKWLDARLNGDGIKIHVFCGIGNNGGDGLVMARYLKEAGYSIHVYIVNFSDKRSSGFLANYDRIKNLKYWPTLLTEEEEFPEISDGEIVVDAIFGIGLNRTPVNWVGNLMSHINDSGAFVISLDIPSGLYMHAALDHPDYVIKAQYTLSFQSPKLVFFLPSTGIYTQDWEALDIGIDNGFLLNEPAQIHLIHKKEILPLYKPRKRFSHKGTYGHGLIIGGSFGKIGAPLMAAEACLNSGAGLVTAFIPECGYIPFQTAFPEAMVLTDENEKFLTNIEISIEPAAIGIGPGMGKRPETVNALTRFLEHSKGPFVIDADALNIISENTHLLELLPENTILTPHPKELERLIGSWDSDFQKLEKASEFASKHKLILILKDAFTMTVCEGRFYVNNTGNPGMATGGSGDVLTGILTGLLAQGYNPLMASLFGVYLHGRAGDLAVEKTGYHALTATDIIDFMGDAYLDLFQTGERKE